MIRRIILRIFINALALYIASYYIPGISYEGGLEILIIGGIILGLLNAIVKPVMVILSCPLILLTLGLFYIVINTIILYIASILMTGYSIHSFISAIGGSLVISVVNWLLSWLFAINEKEKIKMKND